MWLTVLQCTGSHNLKNYLASNVSDAKVEELCVTLEAINFQLPLLVSGRGDLWVDFTSIYLWLFSSIFHP